MARESRFEWIADTMDLRPGDHVLEIGAGSSPSVTYLSARLPRGRITVVDRSPTAIARSAKKHAALLDSGMLRVLEAEFGQLRPETLLDRPGDRFDKILAVNVNLFWTGPATTELALIRDLLAADGTLYLVYGYGTPESSDHPSPRPTSARLSDSLSAAGFRVHVITSGDLLCAIAAPRGD
ncbi:SAM-dependent methyltransferase [Nocardia yamanashiensis]|uniref:SAM-dependent methyltransferase n=1 Tax=Nocardia yamanashiensis TaxID=209247 RepID=UPI00083192CA|nr:class I SAM-dependent methyltransferase [Nocardia yamanashiensis]